MAWAELLATLRIDQSKLKADVEAGLRGVDTTAAGRRMGDQLGGAAAAQSTTRMRDSLGRFTSDAGRAGGAAGQAHGRGFGAAFDAEGAGRARDALGRFAADAGGEGSRAGDAAGKGFAASFTRHLSGLFSGRGAAGLGGGIGPGILGLSARNAGIAGLGGAGLGTLPALLAGAGALGVAGAGVGVGAAGFGLVQAQVSPVLQARQKAQAAVTAAQTPAQAKAAQQQLAAVTAQTAALSPALRSILASETKIQATWQQFTKTLAPLFTGPLAEVARQLSGLTPVLHGLFASAATLAQPLIAGLGGLARQVLPLLSQAFRAVAPLLAPLLSGLTQLLTGLLPGLIALLRAAGPAVRVLANFLGELGRGLGAMLTTFAPVVQLSARILGALLNTLAGLLPVVGQIVAVFAREMGPAFTAFAGIIASLLPFLVTVARVVAELASAVLTDLVAALGALGRLFAAIAPALSGFLRAIGSIFTVLENTGVFAILGNALESIAAPLGALIAALLRGLTPILPPLIGFIGQLAALLATILAGALGRLIPPLIQVSQVLLSGLAQVLPPLAAAVLHLATMVGAQLGRVIVALLPSMTTLALALVRILVALLPILPPIINLSTLMSSLELRAIIPLLGVISTLIGWLAKLAAGLAVVVNAVVQAAVHWQQSWTAIRGALAAAWAWMNTNVLAPMGRFFTVTLPGWFDAAARFVTQRFVTPFRNAMSAMLTWFRATIINPIGQIFTVTLPGWLDTSIRFLNSRFVVPFRNALSAVWNWFKTTIAAPVQAFFTVTLPGWWDTSIRFLTSRFVTPFRNALSSAWNWVRANVLTPMGTFVTQTVPGWFSSAAAAIGRFWGAIKNDIRGPVAWVVDNVLNGLINVFDWITSHVGLGSPIKPTHPFGLAAGGRIPGYGGGDRRPALLEDGETVVSKDHSRLPFMVAAFRAAGVPGYQAGGIVMPPTAQRPGTPVISPAAGSTDRVLGGLIGKALDVAKITAAVATGNAAALTNAFSDLLGARVPGGTVGTLGAILTAIPKTLVKDAVDWIIGNGAGAGSAIGAQILAFAEQFVGHVPYLWGGSTPAAWDCSGFVSYVYDHFGLFHGRTTAAGLQSWAKSSPATPGGLAFYGRPAHHVGFVTADHRLLSALNTRYGTLISALNMGDNSGYGIPPHGFNTGAGGAAGGPSTAGYWVDIGREMAARAPYLWTGAEFDALNKLWTRESGWNPNARNPSSGAAGIVQDISGNMHGGGAGQIAWGLNYIKARYGDPIAAWAHEVALNWYGRGGWINEPVLGVGRYSGALYGFGESGREYVTPEAQLGGGGDGALLAPRLDRIAALLQAVPAATGRHVGAVVNDAASAAVFRSRYPAGGI